MSTATEIMNEVREGLGEADVEAKAVPEKGMTAEKVEAAIETIAEMISKFDDVKARKRSHAIGRKMLDTLMKRAESLRKNPRSQVQFTDKDFDKFCNRVDDEVTDRYGLKTPRSSNYVRYALLIEVAREVVGDDAFLIPYGVGVNTLFPSFFSLVKAKLEANFKKGWEEKFADMVRGVVAGEMGNRELSGFVAGHKASMATPKDEEKKAAAEKQRKRNVAQNKILQGIDESLADGLLSKAEIAAVIEKAAADRGETLPPIGQPAIKEVGCNPATMTVEQAKLFAMTMNATDNVEAMRELHRQLGGMLAKRDAEQVKAA